MSIDAVGAFPDTPHRNHAHEPIGNLFSYDALSARAQALHEVVSGVYTFSEAQAEAQRCADEANAIADEHAWPQVDLDTIRPSQILDSMPATGDPEDTFGGECAPPTSGGKHRADERDEKNHPPSPHPDEATAGVSIPVIQAPRGMDDTQLIRQVSPLAQLAG